MKVKYMMFDADSSLMQAKHGRPRGIILCAGWLGLVISLTACGVTTASASTTYGVTGTTTSAPMSGTPAAHAAQVAPPRTGAALAYDAARQQLVLFGGSALATAQTLNDTWLFAGQGWTQAMPASVPPAWLGTMAYDAAQQQVVLLVASVAANDVPISETWTWNGSTWTQQHPATSPTVIGASMAYDTATGQIILFGGSVPTNQTIRDSQATWAWNGITWAHLDPAVAPSARIGMALTYDAARQQVLLYGGYGATLDNDLWAWNGVSWMQLHPAAMPPARLNGVWQYDAATQQTLLFGGTDATTQATRTDTWAWNGSAWQQVAATGAPTGSAAYDAATQRLVVYATVGTTKATLPVLATPTPTAGSTAPASQTWLWDGQAWGQLT